VIGIEGEVRSVPPPTVVGSAAYAEFGAVSGPRAEFTKFIPLLTETAVQPAGNAGGVAPSKFSVKVVAGTPRMIERVKLVAPKLLLTLNVRVIELPHGVPIGTVYVAVRVTV
jgi:hypothetical protein